MSKSLVSDYFSFLVQRLERMSAIILAALLKDTFSRRSLSETTFLYRTRPETSYCLPSSCSISLVSLRSFVSPYIAAIRLPSISGNSFSSCALFLSSTDALAVASYACICSICSARSSCDAKSSSVSLLWMFWDGWAFRAGCRAGRGGLPVAPSQAL